MTSTNVTERKRIEQEWRESTVRYEELISRVTAGIYVVRVLPDGETEFEFVSDRWCVIHGVQREAVLANAAAVTDLVHPEDRESFIARNRDALRDQQPFEWEGRFYTGNGRLLWLHMESTPVVRETGEIRWYGVVHDITESKRVETELALQKEYLEAVLETTSDGFWIVDGNKRISRVNPAACRISGYDKDELENLQINDIDAIESPAASAARLARIMRTGAETFETRHRRKDGSVIDVEVTASRLDRPEGAYLVCFLRDITERKAQEEQLRKWEELNRALFDQALNAVFIADMSGRFIDLNEMACEATGYSRDELLDMTVFDLNVPEALYPTKEGLLDEWQQWLPGEQHTFESAYRRKDGSTYPVLASTGVIKYGEQRAVAAAVMDVSEQKKAEKAVQELLSEKQTLLDELRHRIKNNINTMASLLTLQAQTLEDPTAVGALQDARSRVASMGVLYDHLYGTDGGDKGSLRAYLSTLVEREVDLFPDGDRVETRIEVEDFTCPARTLSTVGLITNELITNAMKYAFQDHPAPILELIGVNRGETYLLTVADNGPGVPQPDLRRGTSGFGLMVVTTLTGQLGGTLTFTHDGGARVSLEFPIPES